MARSGYEAVYQDLLRTPEAEACLDSLRHWCATASLDRFTFKVDRDHETGLARTWTCWSVRFGPVEIDFRDPEYSRLRLDFERALEDGRQTAAERIVEANFGVPGRVGTRFCKREVCLRGRTDRRGRVEVRPFSEALLEHANCHPVLSEVRREAEARIVGEMVRIRESPEWGARRARALADAAREEVRQVMLKYREVPDEVLAEAVREAAVQGVMDW